MILILLAYLGGILTIASPCILPVLPFVFARADRPFIKSGLPMLIGMALSFALVASLAAIAGGWAVEANRYGRYAAIFLLGLFGLALLFPELATRATQPLVNLGSKLTEKSTGSKDTINIGRRIISSTRRAASAITISAKAITMSPSASSRICSPKPPARRPRPISSA